MDLLTHISLSAVLHVFAMSAGSAFIGNDLALVFSSGLPYSVQTILPIIGMLIGLVFGIKSLPTSEQK